MACPSWERAQPEAHGRLGVCRGGGGQDRAACHALAFLLSVTAHAAYRRAASAPGLITAAAMLEEHYLMGFLANAPRHMIQDIHAVCNNVLQPMLMDRQAHTLAKMPCHSCDDTGARAAAVLGGGPGPAPRQAGGEVARGRADA